jgi:hypothetical protein
MSCAAACLNRAREALSLAETAQQANCGRCVCCPSWGCEVSSCLCFRLWSLHAWSLVRSPSELSDALAAGDNNGDDCDLFARAV